MKNPLFLLADRVMAPMRRMKADQFEVLTVRAGDVVFLGDSISEGGLWDEWLPDLSVRNRGIDGDTSAGVLARVHSAIGAGPTAVFLLIGTNDISMDVPDETIVANVRGIIAAYAQRSPSTRVFVQSVMPRKRGRRGRVEGLNRLLAGVARDAGATWVDLWPALQTSDGALRPELTADSLHLNGAGYRAWLGALQPHLEALVQG